MRKRIGLSLRGLTLKIFLVVGVVHDKQKNEMVEGRICGRWYQSCGSCDLDLQTIIVCLYLCLCSITLTPPPPKKKKRNLVLVDVAGTSTSWAWNWTSTRCDASLGCSSININRLEEHNISCRLSMISPTSQTYICCKEHTSGTRTGFEALNYWHLSKWKAGDSQEVVALCYAPMDPPLPGAML